MNSLSSAAVQDRALLRKSEAYSILDDICRDLELSETQYEAARKSYEAVAGWLAASPDPVLQKIKVYAHGSTALGTTVRPIGHEDFDVDLICLVLAFAAHRSPTELKKIIGDRLRENARYATMLEEKKRCWRLNYAREFHLDISPTIPNPACDNSGELVPDKKLKEFKPTNPTGYRLLFEKRAKLKPSMRLQKALTTEQRADIAAFPAQTDNKGILRRTTQLLKRNRDVAFLDVEEDIAPISIIITTLAAQSYEFCVGNFTFDTELDVLVETIRMMPHFIRHEVVEGKRIFVVPNETTQGENFAERWNSEPVRARAFFNWHEKALADFEALRSMQGIDAMAQRLEKALGGPIVRKVMDARTHAISTARSSRSLYVAPTVGLSLSASARATPVPRNTYFGD